MVTAVSNRLTFTPLATDSLAVTAPESLYGQHLANHRLDTQNSNI